MSDGKKFLSKAGEGKAIASDYGTYVVGSSVLVDPEKFSVGASYILPGKAHHTHTHPEEDEIIYVVNGEVEQTVGDETFSMKEGDMVYIPAGVPHSSVNKSWFPIKVLPIKFRVKQSQE